MSKKTIVVVGGVAGGATFAARARRLDEGAEIVVLDRGEYVAFANCGLPYFVGGEIRDRDVLLVVTPERLRQRFRLDVRLHSEVVSIDRAGRSVEVVERTSGRRYRQRYDTLVLSPGAAPLRPPIPGIGGPRVFSLRTIGDAERIRSFIAENDCRRAVVVGGGFIGLEMTENLVHLGLEVTLVEMADQVMPPLDREMAEFIHQHLRHHGVDLRLGEPVVRFEAGPDGGLEVHTAGGRALACDFAVSAIGVKPEVELARSAGLDIGERGGIRVNQHLQTSDPHIYAIGDAIEVQHRVAGGPRLIPLAGLANKQGRIAADHAAGKPASFGGALGTNVVRIFDLTVASTGANERALREQRIPYQKSYTHSASHAGYYPGATPMVLKILFSPQGGRLLGAQIVGVDGVDKRIDVLATALHAGMTVFDLTELELAYAPQYGTGKDAINIAGYVASNILEGDVRVFHVEEMDQLRRQGGFLLDVRTEGEYRRGHIEGAAHIQLDELRDRLHELPRDQLLLVYCLTGLRSYLACRILAQHGFRTANLSGGYIMYCAARPAACVGIPGLRRWKRLLALETFCSTPQEQTWLREREALLRRGRAQASDTTTSDETKPCR